MIVSILTANSPDELVPFQNVLEVNGIEARIVMDNVKVHQYYSAPGAKLQIDGNDVYKAQEILSSFGNTQEDAAMNIGVKLSKDELLLKGEIRNLGDIDLVENFEKEYQSNSLSKTKIASIFQEEKAYIIKREKNKFDLNEFLAALFEGHLFKYLNRNKSTKYEIENELIKEVMERS